MKIFKIILFVLYITLSCVSIITKDYQVAITLTGITLFIILLSKKKKHDVKKLSDSKNIDLYDGIKHVVGLPLAENTVCVITYLEDAIKIQAGNSIFNLSLEKITDMTMTTDIDIQRQYVSSVGGAVGGLVLFGPLGAMVGGRNKKKESKKITNYFIITYKDNEEIKYISFDCTGSFKIHKFIERFKSTEKEAVIINL